MTHGNHAHTRFHLADRINRETVKNLKLGWSFEMDVTEVAYNDPNWIATRYGPGGAVAPNLAAMDAALKSVVKKATQPH